MYIIYHSCFRLITWINGTSVEYKELKDNPGVLPLKLGDAKVVKTTHIMLHYCDLTLIANEMNSLYTRSVNITDTVNNMKPEKPYLNELTNFMKIMEFIQEKVSTKLNQIVSHSTRTKRGLINVIGSMFKAVTGNLDASDGERYDKEISNLQKNSNKEIQIQKSLAMAMIEKFNATMQNLNNNNKLIENKLNEILPYVQDTGNANTCIFLKEVVNEIISMYEIIYDMLQDIENSLVFARIGLMHPSIIRTNDLFTELCKLKNILAQMNFPHQ